VCRPPLPYEGYFLPRHTECACYFEGHGTRSVPATFCYGTRSVPATFCYGTRSVPATFCHGTRSVPATFCYGTRSVPATLPSLSVSRRSASDSASSRLWVTCKVVTPVELLMSRRSDCIS
jgi:hypothetical protein